MEKGGFAIKKNPVAFTAVGVDQAQEHINKIHKGDGGISGINNNTEALKILFEYSTSNTTG